MKKDLKKYGDYKNDIFNKLDFPFENGKDLLDVGCGDGIDAEIFSKEYKLNVSAIDIYTNENIKKIKNISFKESGIFEIPFQDESFDYIFLHDVLHHIDEEHQSKEKHLIGLKELARVIKKGGYIIIVEGNRYNPLFYPHMVKMRGHNHWKQSYFKDIIKEVFDKDDIKFKFFEAHAYPFAKSFWKVYESLMENIIPENFRSYNIAIIKKN